MTATLTAKEYADNTGIGQRLHEVQRITLAIESLKETLEQEKAYLQAHAVRNGYSSLRCGSLLVSRRTTTSWVYSQAVKNAEAKVKASKAKEQANGTAIGTKSESLVINISGKIAARQASENVARLEALAERTPASRPTETLVEAIA